MKLPPELANYLNINQDDEYDAKFEMASTRWRRMITTLNAAAPNVRISFSTDPDSVVFSLEGLDEGDVGDMLIREEYHHNPNANLDEPGSEIIVQIEDGVDSAESSLCYTCLVRYLNEKLDVLPDIWEQVCLYMGNERTVVEIVKMMGDFEGEIVAVANHDGPHGNGGDDNDDDGEAGPSVPSATRKRVQAINEENFDDGGDDDDDGEA